MFTQQSLWKLVSGKSWEHLQKRFELTPCDLPLPQHLSRDLRDIPHGAGGAVNGLPAIKVIVVTCEAFGIFTTCHPWLRLSAVVESGQSAPYPEANSARSSLRPR